jgi:hypothetical protein
MECLEERSVETIMFVTEKTHSYQMQIPSKKGGHKITKIIFNVNIPLGHLMVWKT